MRACLALASATLFLVSAFCFPQALLAQEKPAAQAKKKKSKVVRAVPAAKALISSLSDEQKEKAVFSFDAEQRVQWHFIPKPTRKGMPVMEMEAEQKKAAMAVLRSVVSSLGFDKATTIMQLESVLLKLEGPERADVRNPEKYYFTFFGEPSPKNRWGLSIEGHHLSLNFVLKGSKILDSTPQFFATNPAKLPESFGENFPKGLQVLRAEEQLGFKLVKSLDDDQLAKAMLPGETPSEIRGAGEVQPTTTVLPGLSAGDMNDDQKAGLKSLMEAYTKKMRQVVAKERWELIEKAGFDNITFTWSGAKRLGVGHYYVVQGPTFVIEFINVQPDAAGNPANHVHCVWRDMQGDFDLAIE